MQNFDMIAQALRNYGFENAEAEDGVLIVTIGDRTRTLEFEFDDEECLTQDAANYRRQYSYKNYYRELREDIFYETFGIEIEDIPYVCTGYEEVRAYEALEKAGMKAEAFCGDVDALADILFELAA